MGKNHEYATPSVEKPHPMFCHIIEYYPLAIHCAIPLMIVQPAENENGIMPTALCMPLSRQISCRTGYLFSRLFKAANGMFLFIVASQTQCTSGIVHSQKSRIHTVVWIVTGCALHRAIKQHNSRQGGWIIQGVIKGKQC